MFNLLKSSSSSSSPFDLTNTADEVLAISLTVDDPSHGAATARYDQVIRSDATTPLLLPATGSYTLELHTAAGSVLHSYPFPISFQSEYSAHGNSDELDQAGAHMIIPVNDHYPSIRSLARSGSVGGAVSTSW